MIKLSEWLVLSVSSIVVGAWLVFFLSGCGGSGDGDREQLNIFASEGSCVQVSVNGKVELREVDAAGNVTDQRCLTDDDVDNSISEG